MHACTLFLLKPSWRRTLCMAAYLRLPISKIQAILTAVSDFDVMSANLCFFTHTKKSWEARSKTLSQRRSSNREFPEFCFSLTSANWNENMIEKGTVLFPQYFSQLHRAPLPEPGDAPGLDDAFRKRATTFHTILHLAEREVAVCSLWWSTVILVEVIRADFKFSKLNASKKRTVLSTSVVTWFSTCIWWSHDAIFLPVGKTHEPRIEIAAPNLVWPGGDQRKRTKPGQGDSSTQHARTVVKEKLRSVQTSAQRDGHPPGWAAFETNRTESCQKLWRFASSCFLWTRKAHRVLLAMDCHVFAVWDESFWLPTQRKSQESFCVCTALFWWNLERSIF